MTDEMYKPLQCVEEIIGRVESWPTYILMHMFYEEPGVRVMKNVAAFLYGNGVPVEKAADCYAACRGQRYVHTILNGVSSWYKTWDRYPCDKHVAQYYSMRSKHVVWLNGRNRDVEELALPEVIMAEIGVEGAKKVGARCEEELRRWINNVRAKGCREENDECN